VSRSGVVPSACWAISRERPRAAGGGGMGRPQSGPGERQPVPLADAAKQLMEECRMVLPGIQALFGFQLVAVFETPFPRLLTAEEQQLHLAALGLVAIAAALVMTPAAYHRQTCPREVTAGFVRLSSRLLLAGMVPLPVGGT